MSKLIKEASIRHFEQARHYIPGGIQSNYRKDERYVPTYISHGRDARLFDIDGNGRRGGRAGRATEQWVRHLTHQALIGLLPLGYGATDYASADSPWSCAIPMDGGGRKNAGSLYFPRMGESGRGLTHPSNYCGRRDGVYVQKATGWSLCLAKPRPA